MGVELKLAAQETLAEAHKSLAEARKLLAVSITAQAALAAGRDPAPRDPLRGCVAGLGRGASFVEFFPPLFFNFLFFFERGVLQRSEGPAGLRS